MGHSKILLSKIYMFVDEVVMQLKAGDGGDGCVSFRREKFLPKGGPNGGDGGKGGSVLLLGDENVSDLTAYYYKPHDKAQNGEPGRGQDQYGAGGEDCILRLPLGTTIYDAQSGILVADITHHNQQLTLLKGGLGGKGNQHFKSSTNQTPVQYTPGKPGQSGTFRLELKTIADIGFVGFPNAGKSSLTNALTRSQRKVAPYPFTTLNPSVGVIEYPEQYDRLRVADIPGLIRGASQNKGLGHRFLRHIERCQVLLLIIDMAGQDGRLPWDDYHSLREELSLYNPALLEKPLWVAANKMDLPEAAENLPVFRRQATEAVLPIACLTGLGLEDLKSALYQNCRKG